MWMILAFVLATLMHLLWILTSPPLYLSLNIIIELYLLKNTYTNTYVLLF
jgi:hypothetical protein